MYIYIYVYVYIYIYVYVYIYIYIYTQQQKNKIVLCIDFGKLICLLPLRVDIFLSIFYNRETAVKSQLLLFNLTLLVNLSSKLLEKLLLPR